MATHSSILAQELPWTVWWAAVHGVSKESNTPWQLNHNHNRDTPSTISEQIFELAHYASVNTVLRKSEGVFFNLMFIGVQLINNAALVLEVQQGDSVIHTHISALLQILFPYGSLQSTKQSSLATQWVLVSYLFCMERVCIQRLDQTNQHPSFGGPT